MYEDKKKGFVIDWKKLLIRLAILFVALFLILWVVSLVKKRDNKPKESNISVNLKLMKEAAEDYFVESKLPTNVNGKKKITLGEMVEDKLLIEFKDQDNNSCSSTDSYAEATKINSEDYTLKVKLVCGEDSDYVINTFSLKASENSDITIDDNLDNQDEDDKDKNETNQENSNDTNKEVLAKPNNNSSISKKPSTNNTSQTSTCKYGSLNYNSSYPVAYKVTGCAVTRNTLYLAKHTDIVNSKAITEYQKIVKEVANLEAKTKVDLFLESPAITPVINKESLGYVGFQIKFTVKTEKTNNVVYEYYIDSNNNRVVVTDNRSSISNNSITSISLNATNVTLNVNNTYQFVASVSGSTNYSISWKSSNSSVASVSSTGKVTAKKAGTATITATVENKSVSATVTVKSNNTGSSSSSRVKTETIYVGETKKLNLLSNYTGVLWYSKDNSIATVDRYGNVTGRSVGRVNIVAYVPGVVTAPMPVEVKQQYYAKFITGDITLRVGETYQLRYITNDSTVSFGCTNSAIVTVNKYGKLTAVKPGEATVTIRTYTQVDTIKVRVIN